MNESYVNQLLKAEEPEGIRAWAEFFMNVPLARKFLTQIPKEVATACLNQGLKWSGQGWSTSRASRKVYELTGVPLVSSRVEEYRDAFLFALAMALEVEIQGIDLGDRASEVAYHLCSLVTAPEGSPAEYQEGSPGTAQQEAPAPEEESEGLEWDEPTVSLPRELEYIWSQVALGKRKLELRSVLEDLPKFTSLPTRAPENNFRGDGRKEIDKTMRTWQQQILHMLRMQAVVYAGGFDAEPEDLKRLHQQLFQLMCELYHRMSAHRKESSVPGSVATTEAVLFEKEELQNVAQTQRVNQMGRKGVQEIRQVFNQKIITLPSSGFNTFSAKGKGFRPYGMAGRAKGFSMQNRRDQGGHLYLHSGMAPRSFKGFKGAKGGRGRGVPNGKNRQSGRFLSLSKATELPNLVAKAWRLIRFTGNHQKWNSSFKGRAGRLEGTTPHIYSQDPGRDHRGRRGVDRLYAVWCGSGDAPTARPALGRLLSGKRHRSFGSLVYHNQTGAHRSGKEEVDCRLSSNQQTLALQDVQNGTLGAHFSVFAPRFVGNKNRLEGRIFSSRARRCLAKMRQLACGPKDLQVRCSPIWAENPPRALDSIDESFGVSLEKKRNPMFCVPRRHLVRWKGQTQAGDRHVIRAGNPTGFRIGSQPKEKCVGTHTTSHAFGVSDRFCHGHPRSPPRKTEGRQKRFGKNSDGNDMSPRKMAAILGQVRSFNQAIPALRSFTDKILKFVRLHSTVGWDQKQPVPGDMKEELSSLKDLLQNWKGRPLGERLPHRTIHSDSSDYCWGAKDITTGNVTMEYWRNQRHLHINTKELGAAVQAVQALGQKGDHISLCVDNLVAFHYLRKGGRVPYLNKLMRDLWHWCWDKDITVTPRLVPSSEDQADYLTRNIDHGDYTLDSALFGQLKQLVKPWVQPSWDMFASPGNKKYPNFVSRFPHAGAAKVDALTCSLEGVGHCYANPPWKIIHQWLMRLKQNPHLTCWLIVPFWDSMSWFPLLAKMQVPKSKAHIIEPYWGMFTNCLGEGMPPPRWRLLSIVLSGGCWKEGKCRIRALPLT